MFCQACYPVLHLFFFSPLSKSHITHFHGTVVITFLECVTINAEVIGKSFAGARPDFSNRPHATFSMIRVSLVEKLQEFLQFYWA